MWKLMCIVLCVSACCSAVPLGQQRKNMPIMAREDSAVQESQSATSEMQTSSSSSSSSAAAETEAEAAPMVGTLTLPSNATSIRADITDNFSCANKTYGYYADVENDCQIFHVCLPVTYADGKENTFRWSFICPEETIFSQESFTCMRREDMTIECEDSYRYYELNGNFGLPVEEEKESGQKQPATAAVENEKPDEEQEEAAAAEPAVAAVPEPAMEPVKPPVKVQKPKPKPNRRKPAITYNKPQRKVPVVVATAAPIVEAVEEAQPEPETVASPVTPLGSKPLKPQRFSIRPNKEKPQAIKPVVPATSTPIRNELFNSIRKRPAIFNKNSVSSSTMKPQQESEPTVTEAIIQAVQAELSEPQPTLKLQTMFVKEEAPAPDSEPEEPAAQASEPAVVIAQPETEPEPVVEAVAEPEPEPEQTKPEEVAEEAKPIQLESDNQVDEVKPIEAIEEIPAVIVETLQEKPQEIEQPAEDPVEQQQETKPVDNEEEEQKLEAEASSADTHIEPAIVEPSSSNEETINNIETMEAAKPADAPESLPATPEMEHPSPLVEQMLDSSSSSNNEVKESIGGFKPVDPVMAAEAEQLITDFLNTLRKQEEKTETELAMAETIEPQPQIEENDSMLQETLQQADNEAAAVSIEEAKLPEPEIVDKNTSVEEQLLESEPQQSPSQLKLNQDSPIINIMQLHHLPGDYQIPVQVIAAPEPVQEVVKETETQSAAEPEIEPEIKPVEAAGESLATAAYMPPISIDDIVELVKERLDQNPKNEQLTPMELVLTPGAATPMALIQSEKPVKQLETETAPLPESVPDSELQSEPAPIAEQQPVQEPEQQEPEQQELILPIYKRVSVAEPAMSKVQTAPVTVSKVESEQKPEQQDTPAVPEVREPKSSSRMDARKRRFLFRADAS